MKVLFVLLGAAVASLLLSKGITGHWQWLFSGNLAMCIMLLFTALGHFRYARGMIMMVPGFIPCKQAVVFWSSILEMLLGLALLFPATRFPAGVLLIALFILLLPANIQAAAKHIRMEQADYGGRGMVYLWFRVPLQLFFIAWAVYFSVYN